MSIIAMSMVGLCRIEGYQILVAYCTFQRVTQTFYTFIFLDRIFTFSHSTSTVAFYHSRIRMDVFRVAKLAKQPHSLLVALDVDVPADDSAAVRRELEAQLSADSMSGACHLVKQHHTVLLYEKKLKVLSGKRSYLYQTYSMGSQTIPQKRSCSQMEMHVDNYFSTFRSLMVTLSKPLPYK